MRMLGCKRTWVEGLAQLKDFLVQLDVLDTGLAPLLLGSLELVYELRTALLHGSHVRHLLRILDLHL